MTRRPAPRLFAIAPGPLRLQAGDPRLADGGAVIDTAALLGVGGGASDGFEMDGRLFRLPASAPAPPTKEEVPGLVAEALGGVLGAAPPAAAEVERCVGALRPLSAGGLKSCLQKAIRFRAAAVDLAGPGAAGPAPVAAPVVAAVCAGALRRG